MLAPSLGRSGSCRAVGQKAVLWGLGRDVYHAARAWASDGSERAQDFTVLMAADATAVTITPRTLRVPADALPDTVLLRLARVSRYVTTGALPLYTVRWKYGLLPT